MDDVTGETASTFRLGVGLSGLLAASCLDFSTPPPASVGEAGGQPEGADECPAPGVPVGVGPGAVMANWRLRDKDREPVALHDACGKVVLVSFGAGWCLACREEMPEFVRWQEAAADDLHLHYVLWQDDANNPASSTFAAEWVAEYAANFPIVTDPVGAVREAYAPNLELPITVLADRRMVIRAVDHYPNVERLREDVDALIAE